MSIPNELSDLFTSNNEKEIEAKQKIVDELLNDNNLERKTELDKPIRWACLSVLQNVAENKNMIKTANIIQQFTQFSFKYLISHDRKSRKEIVEALQSIATIEKKETVNPAIQLMKSGE